MSNYRRLVVLPVVAVLAVACCLISLPPASAEISEGCRQTPSLLDFNGDGFDDAAVGDPYATVDGKAGAGSVTVLFGDSDGRIGEGGRTVITQATLGDVPETGDHFGFDVALDRADLEDRCADLLIGVPGEDLAGQADAGMAYLVRDIMDVEDGPELEAFALTQDDGAGSVEAGDELGYSVAIMGPTYEDPRRLVVGAPGESEGRATDAGAVNVWRIQDRPLGLAELHQGKETPLGGVRLPGTPETGDRFGSSLAVGLVDLPEVSTGTEIAQGLFIGAPGDTVSGQDAAGSVTVVQEEFESTSLISQATAGVPGTAERGDQFGYSLALSPQDGVVPLPRTLAVGSPGEDAGKVANTGSVTLFSNTNERFVPRTSFSQATAGVPGANEAGDQFGYSLTFGQRTTLLVGVPTEDVGSVRDAGAVQPVRVPGTQQPLQFLPAISENAAGTPGSVGRDHQFGRVLGALTGRSENILTISSVFAGTGSVFVLSDVKNIFPRSWLPAAGSDRFGWAVTN